MKRIAKVGIGSIVALCGAALAIFSLYQAFTASWEWAALAFAGIAICLAGINLAFGAKVREFFEDLLGGLWF